LHGLKKKGYSLKRFERKKTGLLGDNKANKKIISSLVGIISAILLFLSSGVKLPVLDEQTDAYFENAITKAGVTYATCRIVNASVSIIKESELQLEPGGIGISLAIGQVLDPVDDMTERLSDVLVTAITSLGIQKLAYEISVSVVPPILSMCLLILSVLVWIPHKRLQLYQKTILRIAILVLAARFCLPMSSFANELVHEHFFSKKISKAKTELSKGFAELEELKAFSLPEADGVLGTLQNSTSLLEKKAKELKHALISMSDSMGTIVENLLSLTFLYVGIFLIQVIILPLMVFWVLVKLANDFFLTSIPAVINQ
jgi:hypothetical protein